MATMIATTYLENRYVDRAKLNTLLQHLFGQSYSVVVSIAFVGAMYVSFANIL